MINRVLCRMPEKNADLLKGMSSFTDCAEDDWCYLAFRESYQFPRLQDQERQHP